MSRLIVVVLVLVSIVGVRAVFDPLPYRPCRSQGSYEDCMSSTSACAWCESRGECANWNPCANAPTAAYEQNCSNEYNGSHKGWELNDGTRTCTEQWVVGVTFIVLFSVIILSLAVLIIGIAVEQIYRIYSECALSVEPPVRRTASEAHPYETPGSEVESSVYLPLGIGF